MRDAETVTFGGSALDRAAHLRSDAAALARLADDPRAGVLALADGAPLLAGADTDRLAWLAPDHPRLAGTERLFLGLDHGRPRFAAELAPTTTPAAAEGHPVPAPDGHAFAELRHVMTRLTPREAELAVTAKGLAGWHAIHPRCARCGAPSEVAMAGWQRRCPACGAHHFPRTDPVVIMLVTHGNSALLGRAPSWSESFFSLLAGFVEPGEPIEAAVRREVFEETGVPTGRVGYLASQPWPFPASLMIGCHATALGREIAVDPEEIAEARWVSREEVLASLSGESADLTPARPGAIAHFVLRAWLADRLD